MATTAIQESEDLESLFDSILAANAQEEQAESAPAAAVATPAGSSGGTSEAVLNQLGQMTRTLHDTLRELGLNKEIEKATASIPDARDRLNYVATLTQQAAERVLNASEAAQPLMQNMEVESQRLSGQWALLFEKKLTVEQFKILVMQTQAFLDIVPKQTKMANAYLMEIIMAQDFQDLTGQVIKKIIDVTRQMESQLLTLLLDNAPPSVKAEFDAGLLNGPVINPNGKNVVTSQDQVDDLLESLGF